MGHDVPNSNNIMIILTAIKRRNKEKRKKNTEKNHQIKK